MPDKSFILDSHLLLWVAFNQRKIPKRVRVLLEDSTNNFYFSSASIWEIGIKNNLGRDDFQVDLNLFQSALLDNEYRSLNITGEHAIESSKLPDLHRDPFDRILIAQAYCERFTLISSDKTISLYKKEGNYPILLV